MPDHNLRHAIELAPPGTSPARRRGLKIAGIVGAIALATAAVVLATGGVSRPNAELVAPRHPLPAAQTVVVALVVEQALTRTIVGDGSVVAWQELVVGLETGGLRVVEVAFEEGDRVTAGQILARLDGTLPAAQLAQAEAAVSEAEAALDIARLDLRRAAELARGNDIARQTLEQRESVARQTEARLLAARARRDEAAARLSQTRVLAPADGIISRRSILPGAVAEPAQEVARIIRDGRLELDARVPELDLAAVRPGQRVRVRHGEHEIAAEVRAIAPTVGGDNRLGIVHVALPAGSGLLPGMFAQAEILPPPRVALTVPQQAVLFRDTAPVVFVLPEGAERVALRPIHTGERVSGVVEVTDGLSPGDRVVTAGAGFLSDGERVRVAAAR